MRERIAWMQAKLLGLTSALQSPLLLFVRAYWGWQFMVAGWGKLHNLGQVTNYFTELGIPLPGANAMLVAGLEWGGGILLLLGLASRWIALPLVSNMLVAYWAADREALLAVFSDPDRFTAAAPFTFLAASLVVLAFGPGRVSMDAWLTRWGWFHE